MHGNIKQQIVSRKAAQWLLGASKSNEETPLNAFASVHNSHFKQDLSVTFKKTHFYSCCYRLKILNQAKERSW